MRNKFEQILFGSILDELETMNRLQLEGVISDNCITTQDVHDCEHDRILKYCFASGIIKAREGDA